MVMTTLKWSQPSTLEFPEMVNLKQLPKMLDKKVSDTMSKWKTIWLYGNLQYDVDRTKF